MLVRSNGSGVVYVGIRHDGDSALDSDSVYDPDNPVQVRRL